MDEVILYLAWVYNIQMDRVVGHDDRPRQTLYYLKTAIALAEYIDQLETEQMIFWSDVIAQKETTD